MIKQYFKIANRSLLKNKQYALLNIGGLAIGMAAAMLIFLWVQNERSYDMFHGKHDRLYMAGANLNLNGEINTMLITPIPMAPALEAEFPEIANTSRYSDMGDVLMQVGDKTLKGHGIFVDSAFLEMFDLPLLYGDKTQALHKPLDVVVTRAFAKRLFDTEDVLGRTIRLDTAQLANITGVMDDIPDNSRFKEAEFFMPWVYMEKLGQSDENWGNNTIVTYIELAPGASVETVNAKIKDFVSKRRNGDGDTDIFLHALPDWWLYTKFENGIAVGGRAEIVQAFTYIACFILIIACINFINLSTARSEKRAKEVGVRKVSGAGRLSLIGQFLTEAILIAFLSAVLALVVVWLALPFFRELLGGKVVVDFLSPTFWALFVAFVVGVGVLAGSYPAFFLSSFQPVKVLKGTFKKVNSLYGSRRILVMIQFIVAIILIICTLIIQKQLEFGRARENGYDQNNLIYVYEEGTIVKNRALIKNELLSSGVAESVTRTSSPLTESWSSSWGFDWEGKSTDDKVIFDMISADNQFVKTAGLKLVNGRDFDLDKYPTDSLGVILNESGVKVMGFDDPIGKRVKQHGQDWHVVGVVEDFILNSPFQKVPPMVVLGAKGWFNIMHIKFNPSLSTIDALKQTEAIFKKYNSQYPFVYTFINEAYAQKFEDTQRHGILAGLFTIVSIIVSCLGLFALSAYMAENRKKEVGVRKALGASSFSVARLLSVEFMVLVLIACLVAFPVSYWLSDRFFLQMYAYRVPIGWGVFILSGIGILFLALLTVSSQAIKAAVANPVNSLRDE